MSGEYDDLDLGATLRGFDAGQTVFGRYRLEKVLGRGGMGVVWLAHDGKLEREVALKFLPELLVRDKLALGDLKRETRRCLDLTHPHIVRVYDFVEDDARGLAAISMEYVDGDNLSNIRAEREYRCYEADELRVVILQLCEALEYAHSKARVAHRDLKPANLMITSQGELKVADFGVARSLVDSASRMSVAAGGSSGTLVYMSPQQAQGRAATALDDIYALGATLYDLLTGKPPFYSGNIMHQIENITPPSLSERRAELGVIGEAIPEQWEQTILACLDKNPAQRPQSAGEVAYRLGLAESYTEQPKVEVQAPEVIRVERETAPEPKRGRAALLVAMLVLLLGCGAVAGWWYGYEQPRREAERKQQAAAAAEAQRTAEAQRAAAEAEQQKELDAAKAKADEAEKERLAAEAEMKRVQDEANAKEAARQAEEKRKADEAAASATAAASAGKPQQADVTNNKQVPPNGAAGLNGVQTFNLPSAADDVIAAQNGRLLIFHLKDSKKLAVFDVVDLKIRGYINLALEPALFAGGSSRLLVAYPSENLIERYSLQTLQKDRTITNPMGEMRNLAMGYASPQYALFVANGRSAQFPIVNIFNVETMTVAASSKDDMKFGMLSAGGTEMLVRASGDGRTYGFCRVGVSPTGFSIVSYKNNQLSLFYQHVSAGLLMPNADGSVIFTSATGAYTPEYASVLKMSGNWSGGVCLLPSYHPMYFIGVPYDESPPSTNKAPAKSIAIYAGRSETPLVYLDAFDEMSMKDGSLHSNLQGGRMTPDKRYHFYPQLNLFITIPDANDRVVVRHIDVLRLLAGKGINYLYATTTPPPVKISQHVNFKIGAASSAGGVTFALQSGPAGLTVAGDGTVNWQAPATPGEVSVIVSLKDTSGQQAYYTFKLVVTN